MATAHQKKEMEGRTVLSIRFAGTLMNTATTRSRRICSETGMIPRKIEPDAMQLLVDKSWTGNIRELRNVVERLLILSGDSITASDVRAYVIA